MSRAIYFQNGNCVGGEFSVKDGSRPCLGAVFRSVDEKMPAGTVFGIDWEEVRLTQVYTAETDTRKIAKIVKIQKEYLVSDSPGHINFISQKSDKGSGILLMATAPLRLPAKARLYPIHLALYALARNKGGIRPSSNTQVLFFSNDEILSVAVEGENIVFTRRFPDNDELGTNVRLSSQSVYFSKQRYLIEPDKILVIGNKPEDAEKIKKFSGKKTEVEHLDVSGYFTEYGLDEKERMLMVLSYGLSLVPRIPALAGWEIGNTGKGKWRKNGVLLRCTALILAALPLFYFTDTVTNKILIAGLNAKLKNIEIPARKLADTINDVNLMKAFARRAGCELIGPDICFELFTTLNKARGNDLWLTAIAGNPYGSISVNATASSYPAMLTFLEHLNSARTVESSELIYANSTDSGNVDFQVIIKYKFPPEFARPETGSGGNA
ncbi:MAG: hypothetical protein A2017_11685 [Lentisphaerae bacterium GWF2_44_16]|nr:MAG: hypothetical protein A2017_11685 [Lentisphaerae bacterium GWF2_44_16]